MNLKNNLNRFTNGIVRAKSEQFTNHPIANLFRKDIRDDVSELVNQEFESFKVKASVGAGNWADVPWISILNPKITKTTQDGIYPVYLFKADGSGFYLSLNQGTTLPKEKFGKEKSENIAKDIKETLLNKFPSLRGWGLQNIELNSTTSLGKSYEKPNISAKYYDRSNIPENEELIADLKYLLKIYKNIEGFDFRKLYSHENTNQDLLKKKVLLINYLHLPKPFLLLAGISGTGKTRFVREQAKAGRQFNETYCLTPVRPDWHEPSDLLGYISRLSGTAEYVTTDVLQFIARAWRGIADNGLIIEEQNDDEYDNRLVVTGDRSALDSVLPYWLCLDEMNLAPVEQYFADYLSVLETREWRWDENQFTYSSDALLKPATIQELADKTGLRETLGFGDAEYNELWKLICQYGLGIPFNLIVAGTVNMDETTHGFSRKVIDRAVSIDFGAFFPNDYDEFFAPSTRNKCLSYPVWSQVSQDDLSQTYDDDGSKSITFLKSVNSVLKNTPFELAYRALNELLLAVASIRPEDELTLKAVWDDFMMCKVLPRIEGDTDKLTTNDGKALLDELNSVLAEQLALIWDTNEDGNVEHRPDLYREKSTADDAPDEDTKILIPCRSQAKLQWMNDRLRSATFTSFWP